MDITTQIKLLFYQSIIHSLVYPLKFIFLFQSSTTLFRCLLFLLMLFICISHGNYKIINQPPVVTTCSKWILIQQGFVIILSCLLSIQFFRFYSKQVGYDRDHKNYARSVTSSRTVNVTTECEFKRMSRPNVTYRFYIAVVGY